MFGGLMKSASIAAVAAAAGLAFGGVAAKAADFGGDCCADLEERVAELEATTVRKGNRKVSLTIYGQVNTGVMYWDNGNEDNVYVVDNDNSSTRFGLKGSAKITPDWSAGFKIELETESASSNRVREDNDDLNNSDILIRQAYWYLQSKQLGRVGVGSQHTSNSGIAEIDLGGTNVAALFDTKQGRSLEVYANNGAGNVGIGQLSGYFWGNGEFNQNRNIVRYDSPEFAGFIVTAAWGEDDLWDVALRYAGEIAGFKIAAGIAYGEDTDFSGDNGGLGSAERRNEVVNGSASVLHSATGLFVTFAAAHQDRSSFQNVATNDEGEFWGVKGGIYQKFISFGKTSIYGEYRDYGLEFRNAANAVILTTSDEVWGGGIVQKIDAAAMELFISYQHHDIDNSLATGERDVDVVLGGGRIKF